MGHPVVHFEIGGRDGEAVVAFYRRLFGWADPARRPGLLARPPQAGGIGGRLMQTRPGMPAYVTVYVQVEDLDATLARAAELGAKRLVEPTPNRGLVRLATGSGGNVVGLLATDR
jgi:hypothetical protein